MTYFAASGTISALEIFTIGMADKQKIEGALNEITPDALRPGMTVRVHERIKDVNAKGEERERVQVFEGIILGVRGSGLSQTFTVRKESDGWGVEKIFPTHAPVVAKMELVKTAKVRRAKLWYLGDVKKRFSRTLKEKQATK